MAITKLIDNIISGIFVSAMFVMVLCVLIAGAVIVFWLLGMAARMI